MKSEFYNNIIAHTLKHEKAAQSTDSLQTARAVFNNMGVALPGGDMGEVYETLKTNDYMGWRACTAQDAQAAADKGVAAIAISEDEIIILAANDADEPIETTASVMTLSDVPNISTPSELAYFCYNYGNTCGTSSTTVPKEYCGGSDYRNVKKHTMVLSDTGYYVCSKCGYTVKSPALQDKDVLNKSDYLAVVSLLHEYLSIQHDYPIFAEKLLGMIDAIRGLPKNKTKYEYCDRDGMYVPEYNVKFGATDIVVSVNQGSCATEWVLLNISYSLLAQVAPFPYSTMISLIGDLVSQEHPGASQMTGAEIAKNYASYMQDVLLEIVPENLLNFVKPVSIAANAYLTYNKITNDCSCTGDCYNVNIMVINKSESCDFHQIKYHYSGDVDTMGRYSEYNLDGINIVNPSANYRDTVNGRYYDVYNE